MYELLRGGTILGVVSYHLDDFPTRRGTFTPSNEFDEALALLFKREHELLESGYMDEWRIVREEIDAPGIVLRPMSGDRRPIVKPLIHIDGAEVWWS
jgi:hypothetical protein